MLHEVARELARRPDLELIEIQGYADSRGSNEYNQRALEPARQRVFDWLMAHGVAPERLESPPKARAGSSSRHDRRRP